MHNKRLQTLKYKRKQSILFETQKPKILRNGTKPQYVVVELVRMAKLPPNKLRRKNGNCFFIANENTALKFQHRVNFFQQPGTNREQKLNFQKWK